MKHWQYQNPVEIHFGAGVLETLPKVLAGRNATLVTFPEAESFGLLPRLRTLLGTSLTGVIDQTQPNPDVDGLDTLYRASGPRPMRVTSSSRSAAAARSTPRRR